MKVVERIAEFLASKGCRHAFGVVGGANSLLFSEVSKRMEIICTQGEQAAAMAATYYYRTCGRIAPVLVTAGGGAINAMPGVKAAHMDGIPLLVISGQEKSVFLKNPIRRSCGFQGFLPDRVAYSFTKLGMTADNPLGARMILEECYKKALEHRQGACWLDLPQDIAGMQAE